MRGGRIERPAILVVHANDQTTLDSITRLVVDSEATGSVLAGIAIDASTKDDRGGTGTIANWQIARQVAVRYPTMLAGGLHPENVAMRSRMSGRSGLMSAAASRPMAKRTGPRSSPLSRPRDEDSSVSRAGGSRPTRSARTAS